FTASDGSTAPGVVTVEAGSYTDVAGNLGATGTDSVPIATAHTTELHDIADGVLSHPDNSSQVTFTFSEAVSASTVANLASGAGITVTGGPLSALTWLFPYTTLFRSFTASDGSTAPGVVTVEAGSYTDVAGNLGATGTDSVP